VLDIDQEALEFIRDKGGICLILETYPHQNSMVEIPIIQISYAEPLSSAGYDTYHRDGITLCVDRKIFFQRDVIKIRLERFLCFRWLELPTKTMFSSGD
jgi:hypothetical protein